MENTLQHFINNPTGKRAAWSSGQRVEVAIQPWGVQAPPWPLAGFVFWSFRVQTIKGENLQQHIDVVIKWKIVSHGLRVSFNAAQHYTEWRELECCRYSHHTRIPSRVELCRNEGFICYQRPWERQKRIVITYTGVKLVLVNKILHPKLFFSSEWVSTWILHLR